ncbi:PKD domain-containing protein [Methanoregula sp.]|uniref:PKD domain-containing protein n=1 Tax=Methanoregula sp. TaxID=2052170 RepID=UPI003566F432
MVFTLQAVDKWVVSAVLLVLVVAPCTASGPSSFSYTLSGVYTLNGATADETNTTITSATDDVSAVYVLNSGDLTMINPTITTSGDTSSNDDSSFYGLNAAVLATSGSTIKISGGTITTSGSGANGAFPTGTGSTIILSDVTIKATGRGGHGVMATNGGVLTLTDVDITTTGVNSAPLATDRGSGTLTATRGTVLSSGTDSPGIYSTGTITVNDATVTATGAEAAVIEGSNAIILHNTTLAGGVTKTGGTMIYQSMSGDAAVGLGTFTMTDGTYTATAGPAFFVTNTNAVIKLTDTKVTSLSGVLINASGTNNWGNSGSNGGIVSFTADNEDLAGNLITDNISSIAATLKNSSSLTGSINSAALILDSSSSWQVTGDSVLTTLSDSTGISGTTITNIYGNSHTVTYDSSLDANSALGGKTYTLANGGTLTPASASTVIPVADFTGTPTSGTAPLMVQFTDTSTGSPTSWIWTFGDGSLTNATQQNPMHTYTSVGTYSVSLTATNAYGSNTTTKSGYITAYSGSGISASEIGIFRDTTGSWYLDYNNDGTVDKAVKFGKSGDIPVVGDFNADGISDIGVFRPSACSWYLDYNSDGTADKTVKFGTNGDTPVVGDWNNSGITGIGVFRNTTGSWYLDYNNDGTVDKAVKFGKSGDIPVVGDFNADGISDIGMFRPSTGSWYLDYNFDGTADKTVKFGMNGDTPKVGHWV